MKMIKLREATDAHFSQMVALDKKTVERYGVSYSDETWEIKHFRLLLPHKMAWSRVAIDETTDTVIGFCIVSEKHGGVYVHRFIAKKQPDAHVGDVLLRGLLTEFDSSNCPPG